MYTNTPSLKNIKLSVKLVNNTPISYRESNFHIVKKVNNFTIFSFLTNNSVKVIFFNPNFINITGLKSVKEGFLYTHLFLNLVNISSDNIRKIKIDNITASGDYNKKISLEKLARKLSQRFYVRYDQNIFPGLHLKIKELGSMLLFPSGKYSIVGTKCMNHARKIWLIVKNALID